MRIEPFLFFRGEADEALEFYQSALGAKVEALMRFSENPQPEGHPGGRTPPHLNDKVMYASILVGGARIMVSDGGALRGARFGGFAVSLAFRTEAEARRAFEGLTEGGRVDTPIGPTFYSPCFGMVTDRFGVQWVVTVETPPASPEQ